MNERLYRSRDDRVIAGVAGGLAESIDVDPSIVRVTWVILAFLSGGLLLLVYIVMALVVPQEPLGAATATMSGTSEAELRAARRLERQRLRAERRVQGGGFPASAVLGVLLVIVGAIFLAQRFLPALDFDLLWPLVAVGLGAALILASFRRGEDHVGPAGPTGPDTPGST